MPVSLLTSDRRTVSESLPYLEASIEASPTWLIPARFLAATILSPTSLARSLEVITDDIVKVYTRASFPCQVLPYPSGKFRGKLQLMDKEALKVWLTSILPEGMSRNDVADELQVTRKTISTMLNPDAPGFANGLTMLRYLQLAGAVVDAPRETPASSPASTAGRQTIMAAPDGHGGTRQ